MMPTVRLANQPVPLEWVAGPLAGDLARANERAAPSQTRPEHSIKVIRDQLLAPQANDRLYVAPKGAVPLFYKCYRFTLK